MLAQTFGCVRFVYNYFLSLHIDKYVFCNHYLSYVECANEMSQLKQTFAFLKDVDSIALQQGLRHLDTAFRNFFERPNAGYPKYKSKRSRNSYTTVRIGNNIRFEDSKLKLPKLGYVKVKKHREIPNEHKLKSVTVSEANGNYYASVLFEHESQVTQIVPQTFIGLDYSSPCLYIDSNGNEPDYPKFFRKAEEKLAKEQRKLSNMKLHSKNWYKQKKVVDRIYEHIANQRKDFLHKLSRKLATTYDVIGIENLNIKAMSQSLKLGKSTMDNGWGMFSRMLEYKLERQGKQLIRVSRWYPSTKTCHECGYVKPMRLNDRQYICPNCGMIFDRDWNAAINIREEAKRIALQ